MTPDASAGQITRRSGTNFSVSFALLPKPKRDAINTVYAFCRCTDDIVDEGTACPAERHDELDRWEMELHSGMKHSSAIPLLNRLGTAALAFHIPERHFFDLVTGMRLDLDHSRYANFEDLREYCWHVASTVGLMCAEIFGYRNAATRGYAVDLGIALQLTNIIRDVRNDARRDRIYLPLEDLRRFNYSEAELLGSVYNEAFVRLLRFQTDRAREWYARARAQLAPEDHRAFLAARIMDRIYSRILDAIEREQFAVFDRKITISKTAKLLLAAREALAPSPASSGQA
jgi:15-cis-phytoene synthase